MMPLMVQDFTWRQSGDTIVLNVKIKGLKAAKTSIVTADDYIRVHFHPYIFEVFLWDCVDDVGGNCTIDEQNDAVLLHFPKLQKNCQWDSLQKELTRDEKRARRERAVLLTQTRETAAQETRATIRQQQKQMVVHEQLRLDDEERLRIAAIKNEESAKALAEMEKWRQVKEGQQQCTSTAGQKSKQERKCAHRDKHKDSAINDSNIHGETEDEGGLPSVDNRKTRTKDTDDRVCTDGISLEENLLSGKFSRSESLDTVRPNDNPSSSTCSTSSSRSSESTSSSTTNANNNNDTTSATAIWSPLDLSRGKFFLEKGNDAMDGTTDIPIRQPGRISVTFTAREFPTPSRESQAAEEAEWLKKQVEARRKCGFNDADLRPEERDPSWLLQKGLSLMKTGSYLGAVSAFSLGIKLASKMPELYVERSGAHLALKNFCKAVEDASQALELLTPKVAQNASDRLKCHRRRGIGFSNLQMYEEGLLDFQEALLLQPDDQELLRERDTAQRALDKHQLNVSSSEED